VLRRQPGRAQIVVALMQETWVDFHNESRVPLLFLAGGADHIMPPSVNKSNAAHYKAPGTLTEYREFPGRSHWTCAEPAGRRSPTRPWSGPWPARAERARAR